jgi:hypothetical protein
VFGKKETVLLDVSLTLGEFDPYVDGAYRNVETFLLDVKQNKKLIVHMDSDKPVDIALSDSGGKCIKFKNSVINDTVEIAISKNEAITLFLGIFRGDKADISVKVRMG